MPAVEPRFALAHGDMMKYQNIRSARFAANQWRYTLFENSTVPSYSQEVGYGVV
jgi:hypothetical protein